VPKFESKRHISSPSVLVGFLLLSVFVLPVLTQGPTQLDPHGNRIPATLPTMYKYAFRLQNSMNDLAAKREASGQAGSPVRDLLIQRFNLTRQQFDSFEGSTTRFIHKEQEIESRISTAHDADRQTHPETRALSPEAKTSVDAMYAEIDKAASDEVEALHREFGPQTSQKLDAAVVKFYSEGQGVKVTPVTPPQ